VPGASLADQRAVPLADQLDDALATAVAAVRRNVDRFAAGYPDDATVDGVYPVRPASSHAPQGANHGWTTGFWPGMLWTAWHLTGDDVFSSAALALVPDFLDRVERRVDVDMHDLGFVYVPSCVAAWQEAGDARARDGAVEAAELLMKRLVEPAGIFQAWGDLADPAHQGRTIIDSLLNMPLLYWASAQTGDGSFADAAAGHARQLRDRIVRPDGSTFHTYWWDPVTGEPVRGGTAQGRADVTPWARGQAWGVYGFALNHRHTGDPTLLAASRRCADYLLERLPADEVPFWDLSFTDGDDEERDSSAAAIAVCGLLELAEALDGDAGRPYEAAAHEILSSLATGYAPGPGSGSDALLLHGVYSKPAGHGVDEGNLWGDYFYLEALGRVARPGWRGYW